MGGLRMLRDHGIIEKSPSSQFLLSINMMQDFLFFFFSTSLTKLLLSFVDYNLVRWYGR